MEASTITSASASHFLPRLISPSWLPPLLSPHFSTIDNESALSHHLRNINTLLKPIGLLGLGFAVPSFCCCCCHYITSKSNLRNKIFLRKNQARIQSTLPVRGRQHLFHSSTTPWLDSHALARSTSQRIPPPSQQSKPLCQTRLNNYP